MTKELLEVLISNGGTLFYKEDFSGQNMSGVNLSNITFKRCNWFGCDLSNAVLTNAKFLACDMKNANMSGAAFSGSFSFENSDVSGINLIGATVNGDAITKQAFAGKMGAETVIITDKFIECGCVVNPPSWFDGLNEERLAAISDPRPGAAKQFWDEFGVDILTKRDQQ